MSKRYWLVLTLCFYVTSFIKAQDHTLTAPYMLESDEQLVTALAWQPNSQVLALANESGMISLWSRDGKLLSALEGHTDAVTSLVWSPDGKTLASGSFDGTIHLWADENAKQIIAPKTGRIFDLEWSPDGTMLASSAIKDTTQNTIQIWDAEGTLLQTHTTDYSGGKFLNVGWSPDGQYLVGGAVDYVEWRVNDGTEVVHHKRCEYCTPAWGFTWSPDSQFWAIGDESGGVWVYDVAGHLVQQMTVSSGADVIAWSPDGTYLTTGGSIWTWDGKAFQQHTGIEQAQPWAAKLVAWSPDSRLIASAGSFGSAIRLWDTDGKKVTTLTGHTANIRALAWSPDGALLASASDDGTVRLWPMSEP